MDLELLGTLAAVCGILGYGLSLIAKLLIAVINSNTLTAIPSEVAPK